MLGSSSFLDYIHTKNELLVSTSNLDFVSSVFNDYGKKNSKNVSSKNRSLQIQHTIQKFIFKIHFHTFVFHCTKKNNNITIKWWSRIEFSEMITFWIFLFWDEQNNFENWKEMTWLACFWFKMIENNCATAMNFTGFYFLRAKKAVFNFVFDAPNRHTNHNLSFLIASNANMEGQFVCKMFNLKKRKKNPMKNASSVCCILRSCKKNGLSLMVA